MKTTDFQDFQKNMKLGCPQFNYFAKGGCGDVEPDYDAKKMRESWFGRKDKTTAYRFAHQWPEDELAFCAMSYNKKKCAGLETPPGPDEAGAGSPDRK